MRLSLMLIALLAVSAMGLLVTGCNGPAPGLNPTVTLTLPADQAWPYFPADGLLLVQGAAKVSNDAQNPVISHKWEDGGAGLFVTNQTGDADLSTVWRAPKVAVATDVTLTLTVKTLQGGKSEKSVQLIVQPIDGKPQFDFAEMQAAYPDLQVNEMEAVPVLGTVTGLTAGVSVTKFAWTVTPAVGTLVGPNTQHPYWVPPLISTNDVGVKVPLDVVLTVTMTASNDMVGTTLVPLRVVPRPNVLIYDDSALVAVDPGLTVTEGTAIHILGSVLGVPPGAHVTTYNWTLSSDLGTLSGADTANPYWVAPLLALPEKSPITVVLTVRMKSSDGTAGMTMIPLRVIP
jgi:hypothetical protein